MPLPKGANDPAVRAAWIAARQPLLAEFDRLVGMGVPRKRAARQVGRSLSGIERTRESCRRLATDVRVGRSAGSSIDIGLALLSVVRKPHETLSLEDIAAWCDCSRNAIWLIEQQALRKLRQQLAGTVQGHEMHEELACFLGKEAP